MKSEITPHVHSAAGPRNPFAAVYRVIEDAIAARAFPGCAFGVLVGDARDGQLHV
jgi:hypothetical protein